MLVSSRMFIEIVATAFLMLTILMLGVGGQLSAEILGTLLGTLGGYLLGRRLFGGADTKDAEVTRPRAQQSTEEA